MATRQKKLPKQDGKRWHPDVEPIMRHLVGRRSGIRTGQAKEVGKRAIDYFRGADFIKWIKTNRDECKKLAPTALANLPVEAVCPNLDAQEVAGLLLNNGFVYRAQWQAPKSSAKQEPTKRPKWPTKLSMTASQVFDETAFYVIVYEGDKTWRYLFLGIIILTVLTIVMWPAWPLPAKRAIWFLLLSLVLSIWAIIAVRLVIFVLFWFFGVDFWVMPNLLNEEIGLLETFAPLKSWERRGDDWYMVAARVACAVMLAGAVYQLGQTHSVSDIYGFANRSFIDVYEWGQKKISDEPADPRKAYPSVEDFEQPETETPHTEEPTTIDAIESEADLKCLSNCGYPDVKVWEMDCSLSCKCVTGIFESKCLDLAGCSGPLRRYLGDVRDEVCEMEEEEKVVDETEDRWADK